MKIALTISVAILAMLTSNTSCQSKHGTKRVSQAEEIVSLRIQVPEGWTKVAPPPFGFDLCIQNEAEANNVSKIAIFRDYFPKEKITWLPRRDIVENELIEIMRKSPTFKDARLDAKSDPKVNGTIIANITLVGDQKTTRYIRFLTGSLDVSVQCSMQSSNRTQVENDLDFILASAEEIPTLFTAVATNDVSAVKKIIADGSNLNTPVRPEGWCVLHYAASYGYEELVKTLLDAGARADIYGAKTMEARVSMPPDSEAQARLTLARMSKGNPRLQQESPDGAAVLADPHLQERFKNIVEILEKKRKEAEKK